MTSTRVFYGLSHSSVKVLDIAIYVLDKLMETVIYVFVIASFAWQFLPVGCVFVELKLFEKPKVCKTGLQEGVDRLAVNICIHSSWKFDSYPEYYCMIAQFKNDSSNPEWDKVAGCTVCQGCPPNLGYVCYCKFIKDRIKCYEHYDFATTKYSQSIWNVEFFWNNPDNFVTSSELQMPTIYELKSANFSIDGTRVSLASCTRHILSLKPVTFKFCAYGLVKPFVSMRLDLLEPHQTVEGECITRTFTPTETRHLRMHMNYSEHHDECDIHQGYNCDVHITNPVSLTVDDHNLLSQSVCHATLSAGPKRVIKFCRQELNSALLEVVKNNIWENTTQHCLIVDLRLTALTNVTYIFKYIDSCNRSKVYKCAFSGFVPTDSPVTPEPNTTCSNCDKEVSTPCYYCDDDIQATPPYLMPIVISVALLLILGTVLLVLGLSRKCCFKKAAVPEAAVSGVPTEFSTQSEAKMSEKKSYATDYESSVVTTDTNMISEDGRSTYISAR